MPTPYTHFAHSHSPFVLHVQIIHVNLTSTDPVVLAAGRQVTFTFAVNWLPTVTPFSQRFERYLDYNFFEHKVKAAGAGVDRAEGHKVTAGGTQWGQGCMRMAEVAAAAEVRHKVPAAGREEGQGHKEALLVGECVCSAPSPLLLGGPATHRRVVPHACQR